MAVAIFRYGSWTPTMGVAENTALLSSLSDAGLAFGPLSHVVPEEKKREELEREKYL